MKYSVQSVCKAILLINTDKYSNLSVLNICVCQLTTTSYLSLNYLLISVRSLLESLQQKFHCNRESGPTK
jgi:D-alanyl-lipoteichoic acid acyltransferase DltB (MBOAT superfamily)